MRKGFYRKLAWTGIRKNKRLYIPYMLTCMGMVMMCYIVSFLGSSPTFANIPGGTKMCIRDRLSSLTRTKKKDPVRRTAS